MGLVLAALVPEVFAAAQGMVITDYQWPQEESPCFQAGQERLLRQGFSQDWQNLDNCENPRELWWVLERRPRMKSTFRKKRTTGMADANEVVFEFESDFMSRMKKATSEKYTGPPKWMPPDLAYWDAYIGDWRYLRTDFNRDPEGQMTGTELALFWIKYEHIEDGIILDASFDFSRLMTILNVDIFRVNGLVSRLFNFLFVGE